MMEAVRNGAWARLGGHIIPRGWYAVEYIESTGTQYVVLDYVPNDKTVVEFDVQSTDISLMLNGVFNKSARFNFGIATTNGNPWFAGIGSSNTSFTISADTNRHVLTLDAANKIYSVSNVGSWSCGSGSVNENTKKMELFARSYNSPGANKGKMLAYGCKIIEDGVVLMNLVPVSNENRTVGALCDVLTGELITNAGTGAFVIGPDKTT